MNAATESHPVIRQFFKTVRLYSPYLADLALYDFELFSQSQNNHKKEISLINSGHEGSQDKTNKDIHDRTSITALREFMAMCLSLY